MLKKLVFVCLLLGLAPSFSYSQINLGLKLGGGLMNETEHSDFKRYRFISGANGSFKVFKQDNILISIRGDGELSYSIYDHEDREYINDQSYGLLVDFFPEISLCLTEIIKLGFGGGGTFGSDMQQYRNDKSDYELDEYSMMYGINLQPGFTFDLKHFFANGTIKYRYLLKNSRWEYEGSWGGGSGDAKYHVQSLDIISSVGIRIGKVSLEGGMQAENWVHKYEDMDRWPKWSEVWEYMLFGKISISFGYD